MVFVGLRADVLVVIGFVVNYFNERNCLVLVIRR